MAISPPFFLPSLGSNLVIILDFGDSRLLRGGLLLRYCQQWGYCGRLNGYNGLNRPNRGEFALQGVVGCLKVDSFLLPCLTLKLLLKSGVTYDFGKNFGRLAMPKVSPSTSTRVEQPWQRYFFNLPYGFREKRAMPA